MITLPPLGWKECSGISLPTGRSPEGGTGLSLQGDPQMCPGTSADQTGGKVAPEITLQTRSEPTAA